MASSSDFTVETSEHESRPLGFDPSVEIVIPTRDKAILLRTCIESVMRETAFKNFTITVVNNRSADNETLDYFDELRDLGIKILDYSHSFNFSLICNLAAEQSSADFLCFLNNDTQILNSEWLGNLLDHASDDISGVIGATLLSPNNRVNSAGLSFGKTGIAGHVYLGALPDSLEKCLVVDGVSFACVLISRAKFEFVGKLDSKFPVGLNDVDFSLRAKNLGLVNKVCSKSFVLHHEYQTRKNMKHLAGALFALRDIFVFLQKHKNFYKN